jgi:ADP-ribose pyrophosphatase
MRKVIPTDAVLVPDHANKVFTGVIYDVYQWEQKLYNGSEATFEMLKRPDTVTVICIVDGKIVVMDEHQPHRGHKRTFPGGRVDSGDGSALYAAKREVKEETGYSFDDWKLVYVVQPHTKIEWFIHVFVASELAEESEPEVDAGEQIELGLMKFDEVQKMVLEGDGYLGESRECFVDTNSIQDLLDLAEFTGNEVDR